jgi:TPR repeat protein
MKNIMPYFLVLALLFWTSLSFSKASKCGAERKASFLKLKRAIWKENMNLDIAKIESDIRQYSDCYLSQIHLFLGELYYLSDISVRDIEKAIYNFKVAIGNDNPTAQYLLGMIFIEEQEFIDVERGIDLLEKAAKSGNSLAKYNLFLYFQKGNYSNHKQALI